MHRQTFQLFHKHRFQLDGINAIYSKKELEKRKFKLSDVKKIMKAVKNKEISFSSMDVPIRKILDL
jgi:hypothetical protein